jgi:hypothetical protein
MWIYLENMLQKSWDDVSRTRSIIQICQQHLLLGDILE